MAQPDFNRVAQNMQAIADDVRLLPHIPAIDQGNQILEQLRLMNRRFDIMDERFDGVYERLDNLSGQISSLYASI